MTTGMTETDGPHPEAAPGPVDRDLSLAGRVALVTGGGRGQGRAHAVALAASGVAAVVVCDVPGPIPAAPYPLAGADDLAETVRLVGVHGAKCVPVEIDVSAPGAVDAAVADAVRRFGRLDVVVANAGIAISGRLEDTDDAAWDALVAVNLTGVFRTLRASLPVMRAQSFGRVVVTSSMGGRMGIPNLAAYNATKWGVIGMAKSAALELAGTGVTVNVVCPCTVATPMVLHEDTYKLFAPDLDARLSPEVERRFRKANPIPEPWILSEDVARAVMYLVNDPGVLTGAVLEIGLGSSARLH